MNTGKVGKEMQHVASHINAILTPFSTASSSTKFMCIASFSFRNQLSSSIEAPPCSSETLVDRELVSTQTSSSEPSTRHLTHTGSSWCSLAIISSTIVVNGTSFTLSSQPLVTAAAFLCMNAAATLSYLTTEKCPTSFPLSENMARRVRM